MRYRTSTITALVVLATFAWLAAATEVRAGSCSQESNWKEKISTRFRVEVRVKNKTANPFKAVFYKNGNRRASLTIEPEKTKNNVESIGLYGEVPFKVEAKDKSWSGKFKIHLKSGSGYGDWVKFIPPDSDPGVVVACEQDFRGNNAERWVVKYTIKDTLAD